MSQAIPEGASLITPYLTVQDAAASLAFYQAAFGFEQAELIPRQDGRPGHVGMTFGGQSVVMFCPEGVMDDTMQSPATSGVPAPFSLYVYCDDVDKLVERARAAGADIACEPEDMFWGDRVARIVDPDGYQWGFATQVSEFDPAKMPKFI
jgi:uncharacterized glyoxalase superfamily protein PhnB